MKTRNHFANIDLFDALRPYDAATTSSRLNQNATIRAEARLEQILATPPNSSPPPGRRQSTRPARSLAQTWGLRLAAIPALAALVIVASTVWPGGGNQQPLNLPAAAALASWQAQPTALPPAQLLLAEGACRAELTDALTNRGEEPPLISSIDSDPVLSEARGNWGVVAFSEPEVMSGVCLIWLADPAGPAVVFFSTQAFSAGIGIVGTPVNAEGVPQVEAALTMDMRGPDEEFDTFGVDYLNVATVTGEGPFTMIFGRVSPEVRSIVADYGTIGQSVATVNNGWFMAWWPGAEIYPSTDPNSVQAQRDRQLAITITATLADGSVVERNTN